MRIAITGAGGFLGKSLIKTINQATEFELVALSRTEPDIRLAAVDYRLCPDLSLNADWTKSVFGVNVLVHAAAFVHVMREHGLETENQYHKINVQGALNLAQQAADLGVKRFIFISSIKVNGEFTEPDRAFNADDSPDAQDAYGISKMEAEKGLYKIGRATGMEIVCIRPPLIYGPEVKGNFRTMMHWLDRRIPLPLGKINNKRSLIFVDNLADLIVTCLNHPAAANQTFLASDGEDLSTTELLKRLSSALNKSTRLLPIPQILLSKGAKLIGKERVAQRLLGNLQIDISKTRQLLDWVPPSSVDDGLKKTAEWYLHQL